MSTPCFRTETPRDPEVQTSTSDQRLGISGDGDCAGSIA
jgi:hypothetical protein